MTQPLWTAAEASAATNGRAIGDWHVTGVSIDTRTLKPGDLFVALLAARDGHDFVATALKNGAGAALVTHIPDGVSPDAPLLIVPDVLRALEALGIAARARTSMPSASISTPASDQLISCTGAPSTTRSPSRSASRSAISCEPPTTRYARHWSGSDSS